MSTVYFEFALWTRVRVQDLFPSYDSTKRTSIVRVVFTPSVEGTDVEPLNSPRSYDNNSLGLLVVTFSVVDTLLVSIR